jgi:hypothetical protein
MTRSNPFAKTLAVVAVAAVLIAASSARAQTKPFAVVGAGIAPDGVPLPGQADRPHWSVGVGSYLGVYFGDGAVHTDTAVYNPSNGHFTGTFGSAIPFTFTGADGDKLVCDYGRDGAAYVGTFELFPYGDPSQGMFVAMWLAEFVPVTSECTGKFAGVTGGWTMLAMSAPFVLGSSDPLEYGWIGQGSLTFKKKK